VLPRRSSLLATALADLAALVGDGTFFTDVVNELVATDVAFEYFQPRDTLGQFLIEGVDVLQYPNVEHETGAPAFDAFGFGSHVIAEEKYFRLCHELGPAPYAGLMLLLRDRYFPTLWPAFVSILS
jgi:hypothetical protein